MTVESLGCCITGCLIWKLSGDVSQKHFVKVRLCSTAYCLSPGIKVLYDRNSRAFKDFTDSLLCILVINSVGTLINNIRSQDLEKGKNFKIFRKLS